MPNMPQPSRIAALYGRQDDPRHPMGWPARILDAAHKLRTPRPHAAADAYDPTAVPLAEKVLHGARKAAASPLWLPLTVPGVLTLAGGMAPTLTCTLVGGAALAFGTSGQQGARAASLGQAPGTASSILRTVLAYGLIGCLTELPAAKLGAWGAQRRELMGTGQAMQVVGSAAEATGYGLALALGACLTVGRLVVSILVPALQAAVLLPAALVGGLWALGSHAVGECTKPTPRAPAAPVNPPSVRPEPA